MTADTRVTIRVDMRAVIRQFKEKGYYETSSGQKILAAEFKGIYVAGNSPPLTWNFQDIQNEAQFALTDSRQRWHLCLDNSIQERAVSRALWYGCFTLDIEE